MAGQPALRIEREEHSGNIWATLLWAEQVSRLQSHMTAFSETSRYGWRYGITKSQSKSKKDYGKLIRVVQVDLTGITPHANPDAFKLHFSCIPVGPTLAKGEVSLLSSRPVNGTSVKGRIALAHKIGSFYNEADGCYILVTARVEGDLSAAHEAFHRSEKTTARAEVTDTLVKSISSGAFIDTHFNAFTRRRKEGDFQRLSHPLPLYAASAALQGLEAHGIDLNSIERTSWGGLVSASDCEQSFVDASDEYEEDSDFDPDEETVIEEVSQYIDNALISESSDTISVGSSAYSKVTHGEIVTSSSPPVSRKLMVTGAAYKTWKAFLVYVYTGEIKFSPLTSRASSNKTDVDASDAQLDCPQCSPKSMYRLAHKLHIEPLKQLAFEEIRSNLHNENILGEVLSKFTAMHPEIREMETNFFMAHRRGKGVMDSFPRMMEQMMRGEMSHCRETLTVIMMAGMRGN